jgi:hypothetical protein
MTTPAGWYDDGSGTQRWWDGTQWTAHVVARPQPAAELPAAELPSAARVPAPGSTSDADTEIAPFAPPFVLPASNAYPGGIPDAAQPASVAPAVAPPSSPPSLPPRRMSVLGLIGLILATAGAVLACVPALALIGWVVLGLALTVSLVSLFFRQAKWPGIAGISVTVIGAILAVAVSLVPLGLRPSPEADDVPSASSSPDSGSSARGDEGDLGDDPADIEGAEMVSFDDLAVGDCIPLFDYDEDEISELPVVPCDQPHTDEVYFIYQAEDGEFPGDDALLDSAWDGCVAEFEAFVGVPYEESVLDIYSYQPTKTSWMRWSDRTVHCIVFSYDEVTGTLEDSAY